MASAHNSQNFVKKVSLLLMVVAVVAIVLLNYTDGTERLLPKPLKQASADIGVVIPYENYKYVNFYCNGNKIFYVTRDGIQLLDMNNDTLWTDTFSMNAPYLITEGGIVGVCEEKGKSLYIYDTKGLKYSVQTQTPILGFSINENGYAALILENDSHYDVNVYDNKGTLASEYLFAEPNVMPLSCDISDDNRILGIALLDINDIKVSSNIVFYYVNKSDDLVSDESDGFFSSYALPDSAVTMVAFMENNYFTTISNKEISFFDVENKSTDVKKTPFPLNNKLKEVAFEGKKNIALCYGEPYNDKSKAKPQNTIEWIDTKGNVLHDYQAEKNVTYMNSSFQATIIGCDREFIALNGGSKRLWNYRALQDVKDLQFVGNQNTVLVAGGVEAHIIKMQKDEYVEDMSLKSKEDGDGGTVPSAAPKVTKPVPKKEPSKEPSKEPKQEPSKEPTKEPTKKKGGATN